MISKAIARAFLILLFVAQSNALAAVDCPLASTGETAATMSPDMAMSATEVEEHCADMQHESEGAAGMSADDCEHECSDCAVTFGAVANHVAATLLPGDNTIAAITTAPLQALPDLPLIPPINH